MTRILVALSLVGTALLTACGGGPSASPTPAAPAPATTGALSPSPAGNPGAAALSPAASPAPVGAPSPALSPASSPAPALSPSIAASPSIASAPPPSTPSPTPAAPPTATPGTAADVVWIADTEGGGVYLRTSPHDGDRAGVLPEGTQIFIVGDEVEGDGQRWYPVRTTAGEEGYVAVIYTSRTAPETPPTQTGLPR